MRKFLAAGICLLLAGSLQAALVAHYDFEADAGDSVGGHNGTLVGDAAIVNDAVRGNVLSLSGAGYVQINNFDYNGGPAGEAGGYAYAEGTSHTLIFWFKTAGEIASDQSMWNHGSELDQYENSVYFESADSGAVTTRFQGRDLYDPGAGKYLDSATSSAYDDGQWHEYLIKKEGKYVEIYIDGVLDATGAISSSAKAYGYPSNDDIYIGAMINDHLGTGPDRFFNGMIDDVRVYNEVVPEPATIALLGFGGLLLARKKRK